MAVGELARYSSEQQAVRDAEIKLDRATDALVTSLEKFGSQRSWAARVRHHEATLELQAALARRDYQRASDAGRRHLRLVRDHSTRH